MTKQFNHAQIKKQIEHLERQREEQYEAMLAAMEAEGWTPQRDAFNYIYAWQYQANRKILSRAEVDRYWRLHGSVPVPF